MSNSTSIIFSAIAILSICFFADSKVIQLKTGDVLEESENFSRSPRVFGGRNARPNEFPYMASILVRVRDTPVFQFICGGTIYNKNYIITAGHCLEAKDNKKIEPQDVRVIVGQNLARLLVREGQIKDLLTVNKTFVHKEFSSTGIYFVLNDLAMLKLNTPLNYSSSVKKLRIAQEKEGPVDGLGDVVGWGRTEAYFPDGRPIFGQSPDLPISLPLKTARLRIIPRSLCTIRHLSLIPPTILCVGSEGLLDTQSACFGDSGGPLACSGPSGPYLCGLVSTGTGCGLRFTPGFYTDVSKYSGWIRCIGGDQ